jgi:uncharacterized membrane protein YeaQ/YmgE (transglycosylase-associated protein family)
MDLTTIISIVTVFVTYVCGLIAKKVDWFNNKLIPIQNLAIGIIAATIYFAITKDFNLAISAIGLGVGGAYDIIHNLNKLLNE